MMSSGELQKIHDGLYFLIMMLSPSIKNSTESIPSVMLRVRLMSDGNTNLPSLSICRTQPIALICITSFSETVFIKTYSDLLIWYYL